MMRNSDKACWDMIRHRGLRGCEVRRVLSVFARIRRAHVRYFIDLMFGSIQPNPTGFQGVSLENANRLDRRKSHRLLNSHAAGQFIES